MQRKTEGEGCKGARAVTPEEWMPGGRILYSETRRVKFDGTRIVSFKLTNEKEVMNHPRSNKDIGNKKEPGAEPTAVTGKQDPSPTMMEKGQEGCGGRTEERIPASGVVWKEAPESAIHSVLTGGVRPVALKDGVRPVALKDGASAA